ncbi:hypothetical protein [Halobacillus litoralis]|uniref:Uncharacterized protein n=1 Tax=Halobacillus litoralis TaxID=45668 RepID=A0A410M8E2_9BACI|nr:hypothetical protein [Halobacillus litoralis]QAS50975.1 hypothetical protein HLI_01555 [Halobacillus litoralis]
MIGSALWNLIAAILGFIFVFFISFQSTSFETAIIRGTICFFSFFLIAFLFRFVWAAIAVDKRKEDHSLNENPEDSLSSEPSESSDGFDAEGTSKMIRDLMKEDQQ